MGKEKLLSLGFCKPKSVYLVPAGLMPYDGVALEVTKTVDLLLVGFCVVIATSGILYAIVCLVFNFYFRNTKYVCVYVCMHVCVCVYIYIYMLVWED